MGAEYRDPVSNGGDCKRGGYLGNGRRNAAIGQIDFGGIGWEVGSRKGYR